ncbi:MAG: hypothetical protein IT365_08310, partial [Candidatus Hydrogenedentes bacterium]|nr:hypothetical protein [Candidatus Hydrogenedentota bacterium]
MRFGQRQECSGIGALQNLVLVPVGLCLLLAWTVRADEPVGSLSALRSKLETYGPGLERGDQMWSPKDYVQLNELMRNAVF